MPSDMLKTARSQNSDASADVSVNFLYKAMVERDPKKRKVKPVDKGLQFSFDLDYASSDDEDYNPIEGDGDDEEGEGDEDDEDDEEDDPDQDSDDGEESPSAFNKTDISTSLNEFNFESSVGLFKKLSHNVQSNIEPILSTTDLHSKVGQLLVCCVCLGEVSHENDEIVECDSCGITVHEGCYGINCESDHDAESVHSNASSSSTEPWFCDACKAGVVAPICELCPNSGGIFKQSDVGRWIHLVCALYVPGVAFADTNTLVGVTLFELPYERWGKKVCSLCEDERFSRTGVCICCDAGLCKTYFHVTCAQSAGLLCEASSSEETELIDPFYAHCKLHAVDKSDVRLKRRNFLALQSRQKLNCQNVEKSLNERITQKLNRTREKWTKKLETNSPWIPTAKMPRMITTSPSAVKRLTRKSELLGFSPQGHYGVSNEIDVSRKWHVPPAFSVEFVSYFLDLNSRMCSTQKRLDELINQNQQLRDVENVTRKRYEDLLNQLKCLESSNLKLVTQSSDLWSALCNLSAIELKVPKFISTNEHSAKHVSKMRNPCKLSKLTQDELHHIGDLTTGLLKSCGTCNKTHDQHLLAFCDSCKLNYHFSCLDPPLKRMPKKTKFGGWQCSDCTEREENLSDDNENDNTVDGVRRLRDHVKGPEKFIPDSDLSPFFNSSTELTARRKTSLSNRKRKRDRYKKNGQIKDHEDLLISTPVSVGNDSTTLKSIDRISETCCKCQLKSVLRYLVQCDECFLYYHFSCLDPPVRKNPKQRGYKWICQECDSTDESSEDGTDTNFYKISNCVP